MTNSNMTCEAFDAALPDYLEGTLDDAVRASVGMHLRECVRCASLVRDLENIQKEAAGLPDLVPSRDLWEGIEARIAAPVIPLAPRPGPQRRFVPAWMAIAAAALVMTTAGITYTLTSRSLAPSESHAVAGANPTAGQTEPLPEAGSPNEPSQNAVAVAPERVNGRSPVGVSARSAASTQRAGIPASLASQTQNGPAHSDAVYGKEIEMLQRIVSQRKTQLDSSTVAIIEKNLQIIDAAIAQSRAALARDPASMLLSDQLTHALDKKVELLRTAALLPAST
ncbi:MAG: zf-HC2 domain-containing protein [Gemmatimonadota bacterium]|nr:zf-HC2 domain-containing protein [Gemmatimonadota bacterium]